MSESAKAFKLKGKTVHWLDIYEPAFTAPPVGKFVDRKVLHPEGEPFDPSDANSATYSGICRRQELLKHIPADLVEAWVKEGRAEYLNLSEQGLSAIAKEPDSIGTDAAAKEISESAKTSQTIIESNSEAYRAELKRETGQGASK
jgi:hypothetical protein